MVHDFFPASRSLNGIFKLTGGGFMRLSELSGKEIVDFKKAERLGVLGQTDLEINENTGHIHTLIIPSGKWMRKQSSEIRVPWKQIRTIGSDMIILEVPENEVYR
jgi:YlmC/YmxH family sporulation protein